MKILKNILSLGFLFLLSNMYGQNNSDLLTTELKKHFEQSDLPGFAVSVVNEKGILYQQEFGYANKEEKRLFSINTVENLGSVSKTVVGLALIKAIEDEKLSLETKISDYLPFNVINPYYPDSPILVRHLANHTSSILDTKNYGKSYILAENTTNTENVHQDFLNFISNHKKIPMKIFLSNILEKGGDWYKKKNYLKSKPGTEQEYSNLNAALVALIIEKATGVSFKEYTKNKIFEPLKMTSTSWSIQETSNNNFATNYFPNGQIVPRYNLITYPDGGLYSSVSDLSQYLNEIIKAYSGKSDFLKPEYAKLLLPGDEDKNRAFWGMGQKSRNIGHGGSDPGVQTDLQFNADSKIGRIIITNVNAEDNENLWRQYRQIHNIIAKYESKFER